MNFGMTYYQLCWYFLIYSFGGWLIEVIFHAITLGKAINRGFLNGPVCPVYGFGVISVFAMINTIQSNGQPMSDIAVFIFGVILATVIELLAGWLLDKCFHARWWDYSKEPLNLHGYICVRFSLIWGLAIVLVVRVFHKHMERIFMPGIPPKYGWVILAILYACYLADFIVTVAIMIGFNKRLKQLDEIRQDMRIVSDKLSESVGTTTVGVAQKVGEGRVQAALAKSELKDAFADKKEEFLDSLGDKKEEFLVSIGDKKDDTLGSLKLRKEELQKRYADISESMTKHKLFGKGHLLRAFPEMKHKQYQDIVSTLQEKINKKKS